MMNIIINSSFDSVHCWEGCNIEEVMFLKNPHRHVFHVEVKIPVTHSDRDIEFIKFKSELESFFKDSYKGKNIGSKSCEMICTDIKNAFPNVSYVKVMEDNENGAELIC